MIQVHVSSRNICHPTSPCCWDSLSSGSIRRLLIVSSSIPRKTNFVLGPHFSRGHGLPWSLLTFMSLYWAQFVAIPVTPQSITRIAELWSPPLRISTTMEAWHQRNIRDSTACYGGTSHPGILTQGGISPWYRLSLGVLLYPNSATLSTKVLVSEHKLGLMLLLIVSPSGKENPLLVSTSSGVYVHAVIEVQWSFQLPFLPLVIEAYVETVFHSHEYVIGKYLVRMRAEPLPPWLE